MGLLLGGVWSCESLSAPGTTCALTFAAACCKAHHHLWRRQPHPPGVEAHGSRPAHWLTRSTSLVVRHACARVDNLPRKVRLFEAVARVDATVRQNRPQLLGALRHELLVAVRDERQRLF
eukprot:351055-Chlamydomonas_euryale.AAC.6